MTLHVVSEVVHKNYIQVTKYWAKWSNNNDYSEVLFDKTLKSAINYFWSSVTFFLTLQSFGK